MNLFFHKFLGVILYSKCGDYFWSMKKHHGFQTILHNKAAYNENYKTAYLKIPSVHSNFDYSQNVMKLIHPEMNKKHILV